MRATLVWTFVMNLINQIAHCTHARACLTWRMIVNINNTSKTTISVAQQIHKSCAFFLLHEMSITLLHTEPSRTGSSSIQSTNYLWSNLVWWFCRHRVDSEANKYPYHQHDQQMNIVKDIDYNHFHWHPPICTQLLIVKSNKWATTCIILEWIIALQGEREPPDPRAS